MSHPINTQRRRLLGTTSALAGLGLLNLSVAQARPTQQGTSNARLAAAASLGAIRQINAGTLDIGYAELGPSNGPVAILLHGWPSASHGVEDWADGLGWAGAFVPSLAGALIGVAAGAVVLGALSLFQRLRGAPAAH